MNENMRAALIKKAEENNIKLKEGGIEKLEIPETRIKIGPSKYATFSDFVDVAFSKVETLVSELHGKTSLKDGGESKELSIRVTNGNGSYSNASIFAFYERNEIYFMISYFNPKDGSFGDRKTEQKQYSLLDFDKETAENDIGLLINKLLG